MAIFYNHIKGCGGGTTGQDGNDLWTWIKWADKKSSSTSVPSVDMLPCIYLNHENISNLEYKYNAGYILTSKATGQSLETYFHFKNGLEIDFNGLWNNNKYDQRFFKVVRDNQKEEGNNDSQVISTNSDIWLHSSSIMLNSLTTESFLPNTSEPHGQIQYNSTNTLTIASHLGVVKEERNQGVIDLLATKVNLSNRAHIVKSLYIGDSYPETELDPNILKVQERCEALYFNATSDRRAKSNITPAEFSALDIIKQLPIYTFNYLNDPKLSVGLIAQEAAEHDLDGFNMVENLDASGEFGDFMQVKESKLVYVLWKAVQELSAEVEELKTQIASLK